MEIKIVSEKVSKAEMEQMAEKSFGDLIKAVVDVERRMMAIGGELHSDEETLLLENGSKQSNLWGINLYPFKPKSEGIEFDSMINIRPRQENRSRGVENPEIREKIIEIVSLLVE